MNGGGLFIEENQKNIVFIVENIKKNLLDFFL